MGANQPADGLVVPAWVRWIGVPVALAAGVVAGLLNGDWAGRVGGVVVACVAALLWAIAVVVGSLKVRRREQVPRSRDQFIRLVFAVVLGSATGNGLPHDGDGRYLVLFANWLSGGVAGLALGSMVVMMIKRRSPSANK